MEELLDSFKEECCSKENYHMSLQLLFTYLNNINENSDVEKYRKLKIANRKFNEYLWKYVSCQTLLLMSGFEPSDNGFLHLPNGISVSLLLDLLKKKMADDGIEIPGRSSIKKSIDSPQQQANKNTLKLNPGGSMFVEELKADLTLLSYLTEMGYPKKISEKALVATKNSGVQPAMDWLVAHPEIYAERSDESSKQTTHVNTNAQMGIMDNPYQGEVATVSRLTPSLTAKHKYQEKLRLEAMKKAKLEKQEERRAKEMLMKNLQSERQAANEKFEMEKRLRHASTAEQDSQSTSASDVPTKDDSAVIIRIRVKLPTGKIENWTTDESGTVADLYAFVSSIVSDEMKDYVIIQAHPHLLLEKSDQTTLKDKGMYPSATLVVMETKTEVASAENTTCSEEDNGVMMQDESSP